VPFRAFRGLICFFLPQAEIFLSGAFPPDKKIALLRALRIFVVKSFEPQRAQVFDVCCRRLKKILLPFFRVFPCIPWTKALKSKKNSPRTTRKSTEKIKGHVFVNAFKAEGQNTALVFFALLPCLSVYSVD